MSSDVLLNIDNKASKPFSEIIEKIYRDDRPHCINIVGQDIAHLSIDELARQVLKKERLQHTLSLSDEIQATWRMANVRGKAIIYSNKEINKKDMFFLFLPATLR